MIGIDTNIVARLLLRDDEDQFARCMQLLDDVRHTGPLFLNPLVVTETVWLLEKRIGLPEGKARASVAAVAASAEMFLPDKISVLVLSKCLASSHPGFFDVMIASINLENGCDYTYTFDKRAARDVPGMELLE